MKCKNCVRHVHVNDDGERTIGTPNWCFYLSESPCEEIERDCPAFKSLTKADIVRAMTDEELANFIVHRDCCPGFFTGTFSDANRKKYGFDGRSERCEFGGEECIACWLDWLKEEVVSDG